MGNDLKHINILSLIQAFDTIEKEDYDKFLVYHGIEIKDDEVKDIKSLISIFDAKFSARSIFNQFYVGYKIPQIGKEFDLLRFGEDYLVNIEIKNSSTEEKILKQLQRNKYYLGFISKKVYHFTYVANENKLYFLNNDNIEEIDFKVLGKYIYDQKIRDIQDIDTLFNPTDYLVSPFNSTKKFIKNKYFLTHQQEEIKINILKVIEDNTRSNFFAITGSAGTGKTLLTYDIAKEVINCDQKVLIIHCGNLNEGHEKLNSKNNWTIIPIKSYRSSNLADYALIIIDEAQRIYANQFEDIVKIIQDNKGKCIFSYDKVQTLHNEEDRRDIDGKISQITSIAKYKLSEKIRTNKNLASFIKMIFNKTKIQSLTSKDNIEISYFDNHEDAGEFLKKLDEQEWDVIRFTPSQRNHDSHEICFPFPLETSHEVIGQEFDNVAVVMDSYFSYNTEKGRLFYSGKSYYHPVKMLFQNMTRTRKKLHIVIINNSEILNRCLSILG